MRVDRRSRLVLDLRVRVRFRGIVGFERVDVVESRPCRDRNLQVVRSDLDLDRVWFSNERDAVDRDNRHRSFEGYVTQIAPPADDSSDQSHVTTR